jgi:hypothetical protein
MKAWFYFWIASFAASATVFALITVLVLVRGTADLRQMFRRLGEHEGQPDPPGAHSPDSTGPCLP